MNRGNIVLIILISAPLILGLVIFYLVASKRLELPIGGSSTSSSGERITYRHEDGPENCDSNSLPVFTHDVTNLTLITRIIPPAGVQERGELKTHSYLHNTNRASVPVYAPADGVIAWGTHVAQQNERGEFDIALGDEYALFIELDCNHYLFFDHITEPNDTIKSSLPADPSHNSISQFLDPPISIVAGELLGETQGTYPGGIWDFGVYDRRRMNVFPPSVREVSKRDEQGVCPYDFYKGDQRENYRLLYDKNYANYERVLELCL